MFCQNLSLRKKVSSPLSVHRTRHQLSYIAHHRDRLFAVILVMLVSDAFALPKLLSQHRAKIQNY